MDATEIGLEWYPGPTGHPRRGTGHTVALEFQRSGVLAVFTPLPIAPQKKGGDRLDEGSALLLRLDCAVRCGKVVDANGDPMRSSHRFSARSVRSLAGPHL